MAQLETFHFYIWRVRASSFIIATLLAPSWLAGFTTLHKRDPRPIVQETISGLSKQSQGFPESKVEKTAFSFLLCSSEDARHESMEDLVENRQIYYIRSSSLSIMPSSVHRKTSRTPIPFPFLYPKPSLLHQNSRNAQQQVYKNRKKEPQGSMAITLTHASYHAKLFAKELLISSPSSLRTVDQTPSHLQPDHLADREHRAIAHEEDRAHSKLILIQAGATTLRTDVALEVARTLGRIQRRLAIHTLLANLDHRGDLDLGLVRAAVIRRRRGIRGRVVRGRVVRGLVAPAEAARAAGAEGVGARPGRARCHGRAGRRDGRARDAERHRAVGAGHPCAVPPVAVGAVVACGERGVGVARGGAGVVGVRGLVDWRGGEGGGEGEDEDGEAGGEIHGCCWLLVLVVP